MPSKIKNNNNNNNTIKKWGWEENQNFFVKMNN